MRPRPTEEKNSLGECSEMRTTFVLTDTKGLQSAIRPRAEPHAIHVGAKVILTAPYATQYGVVPAGAKGFVEHMDEADGTIWVLMEGIEPALVHWDNTLVLSPFTCEELAICTRLSVDKLPAAAAWFLRSCHSTGRLAACVVLAFILGWCVDPPLGAQAGGVIKIISAIWEGY